MSTAFSKGELRLTGIPLEITIALTFDKTSRIGTLCSSAPGLLSRIRAKLEKETVFKKRQVLY